MMKKIKQVMKKMKKKMRKKKKKYILNTDKRRYKKMN